MKEQPPESKKYLKVLADSVSNCLTCFYSHFLYNCFNKKHPDVYSNLGLFICSMRKVITHNYSKHIEIDHKYDSSGKRIYYFIFNYKKTKQML